MLKRGVIGYGPMNTETKHNPVFALVRSLLLSQTQHVCFQAADKALGTPPPQLFSSSPFDNDLRYATKRVHEFFKESEEDDVANQESDGISLEKHWETSINL